MQKTFAVPERLINLVPFASVLRPHGERLLRYFISGVGVSLGYIGTVIVLVELTYWPPAIANIASVMLWTPLSFVLQRDFSFRFRGASAIPARKFAFIFVAKLAISTLIVDLAAQFPSRGYLGGLLANWVLVPMITYILLNSWVFRGTAAVADSPQTE